MKHILKLFILGHSALSMRAVKNLKSIAERPDIKAQFEVDIIDLRKNPELAELHHILATPLLLKSSPEPVRRVIGDLADEKKVLFALGIGPLDEHE